MSTLVGYTLNIRGGQIDSPNSPPRPAAEGDTGQLPFVQGESMSTRQSKLKTDVILGVYRDHRNDIVWVSLGAFNYGYEHVLWLLPYWGDLQLYRWPQCPLEDVPGDTRIPSAALLELIVGVKCGLDARMRTTGKDGQILLDRYARNKTTEEMRLTYAPLRLDQIDRRIDDVLGYICGRFKRRSYREHLEHRAGRNRASYERAAREK